VYLGLIDKGQTKIFIPVAGTEKQKTHFHFSGVPNFQILKIFQKLGWSQNFWVSNFFLHWPENGRNTQLPSTSQILFKICEWVSMDHNQNKMVVYNGQQQ
jgi:hypothetical protein